MVYRAYRTLWYSSVLCVALLGWLGCNGEVNDPGIDAPTLVAPEKGLSDSGNSVELQWNSTASANAYDLQVATDRDFRSLVFEEEGVFGRLYLIYDLPIGNTYFWRVRARNVDDVSDWSETWDFSASREATIPISPKLAFPSDSTQNMPQDISFGWDPVKDATRYHLQVSLERNFIRRSADIESVRGTSQRVIGLIPTYIYYWRVRAISPVGESQWSPVWQLVVEDEAW